MKLPVNVKTKWLKALRSGEYTQTHSTLHNPTTGGFCCLGVLECEMMDGEVEHRNGELDRFIDTPSMEFWDYIGAEVITQKFDKKLEKDPDISALINLNDGTYSTHSRTRINWRKFPTIANWIENNIKVID